jgi:hypothetical protein
MLSTTIISVSQATVVSHADGEDGDGDVKIKPAT